MSAQLGFFEHRLTVDGDLESPAARWSHLQLRIREPLPNLSRQTGGSGLVVSDDAIFDADLHGGGGVWLLIRCWILLHERERFGRADCFEGVDRGRPDHILP